MTSRMPRSKPRPSPWQVGPDKRAPQRERQRGFSLQQEWSPDRRARGSSLGEEPPPAGGGVTDGSFADFSAGIHPRLTLNPPIPSLASAAVDSSSHHTLSGTTGAALRDELQKLLAQPKK